MHVRTSDICASVSAGRVPLPDGSNSGQRTLAEVLEMKAFAGNSSARPTPPLSAQRYQ